MTKTQKTLEEVRRLFSTYTDGVKVSDFKRMFDRDPVQAYEVLARDQSDGQEPKDDFDKFLYRAKVFFFGLSSSLSPARRMLFLLGLVLVAWGFLDLTLGLSGLADPVSAVVAFLAAIVIFFFLFTMELVDRVQVRDELEVAKELQQALLPAAAPELRAYRFAHSYRTANEVGGDYYDFLPLPDGRLVLVVGDASGHGMAAGLLMAIANATLKTALDLNPEPHEVLEVINRSLARTGDRRAFMSLFYGVLDPASGHMDYFCAGHPFPMLRRVDGTVEELGAGALPLGIRPKLEIETATTTVRPGDLLLLYSDGLVEAVRADGESFGFDRLRGLLTAFATPQAVHDRILAAFDDFLGDEQLRDDLTLVVVSRDSDLPPPPPPPPSE